MSSQQGGLERQRDGDSGVELASFLLVKSGETERGKSNFALAFLPQVAASA